MLRNLIIVILLTFSLISCSGMKISDTKPLPKGISYTEKLHPSIILPFHPRKIRYCNYTHTFVALDKTKNMLCRIDEQGKITQRIGEFGFDEGQFVHISDFAVDSFGNIFVVDDVLNLIVQFDDFGQFVNSFTPSEMTEPELIAVQDTGELLIYDGSSNQVFCYTKQNNIRFKFGKFYLNDPQKISASIDVNYIEDPGNNTIFMIDGFGGLLHEISPSAPVVDITSTKYFYYYLDIKTDLYVARRASNEPIHLGTISDLINGVKPSAIVAFSQSICILDDNRLYKLQLIGN